VTPRTHQGHPDWLVIARRELFERIRTKWFVIITAIGPIALIALMVTPVLLARAGGGAKVAIVDHTGKLGEPMAAALGDEDGWKAKVVPADTPEATLLAEIRDKQINGFLTIPADALTAGKPKVIYQGDNATSQMVVVNLYKSATKVIVGARVVAAGLDQAKLEQILVPVDVEARHTTGEAAGTSGAALFILGYAVMFILYLAIILYAVNVLRSVVQEKTNRVVELMVAAARPRALMIGKILGVGAAGLIQISLWIVMAVLMITYRGPILGLFGASGGFSLPPLTVGDGAIIIAYFFLGYFFYAALYAAIGAMVSSEQEAQQAQMPVTFLLIIPMLSMQVVANDPRGVGAEALTQIPFSSPILMPMRWLLGGATTLDALVSLGVLALSTYLVTLLSARIFRVGILMYGKRPSLREVVRWLRY
jgi:ABC-2 type transport system permease protein